MTKHDFNVDLFIQHSNLIDLQFASDGVTVIPGLSTGDILFDNQKHIWGGLTKGFDVSFIGNDFFCNLHRTLTDEVEPFVTRNSAGVYRNHRVWVGYSEKENAENIEKMCNCLIAEIKRKLSLSRVGKKEADDFSWWVHNVYECIHPFSDGNGRSGRLLMNYIRFALGVPTLYFLHQCARPSGSIPATQMIMQKDYYAQISGFETRTYPTVREKFLS